MKFSTKITLVFLHVFVFSMAKAQNNFWTDVSETSLQSSNQKRLIIPEKGRTLTLDKSRLKAFLRTAPLEFSPAAQGSKTLLSIPMPYGGYQEFNIVESSMMEPGLAAAVPDIKTYSGQGVDDPTATIKIDLTSFGFHAMILSPVGGAVFIDPYSRDAGDGYIAYYKKDLKSTKKLIEKGKNLEADSRNTLPENRTLAGVCIGGTLRTYRLAVACTGEYAVAVGATTVNQALAAIVSTINRVNGFFEKELDIRMILVANNKKVVFINPDTDKFEGNDAAGILIDESQTVITDSIGSANYDIGHTFSTGGGGLAGQGVVCIDDVKAKGITGSDQPFGDPYDIDFVAHEMGHQFGASHTFNAITDYCAENGDKTTNVEPGSGSTIMAYAGICGSNNLQANTDPQFHAVSFDQITNYVATNGNSCAVKISTGNTPPVVNAGADYSIPRSTPFILTGSATDANGDALTYSWEEIDFGGPFGNANTPAAQAPIFRSFQPTTTPTRIFPKLSTLLNNTAPLGEVLSAYDRDLNFRLTARDNRSGGGGICFDEMKVKVTDASGPFRVSFPNTATTWDVGSFKTITWDVANTTGAPVNCTNVSIQLSTDGGNTFPITLLATTPNDGTEEIVVPANVSAAARIRVFSVGNIFFDISNVNFTIRNAPAADFSISRPAQKNKCAGTNASVTLKTAALAGFSTPITFSASGNPTGTTVTFSSTTANPGTDVTITISGNLPEGDNLITINAVSGAISKSTVVVFTTATNAVLTAPANNSSDIATLPTLKWTEINGASSYTLQISTVPTFATIAQTITNIPAPAYALTSPLVENTQYYWRILGVSNCGTGTPSTGFAFRSQACDTKTSTNVPLTISSNGTPSVTSNLVVTSGTIIRDLNVVGLKGMHSYVGDLSVTLKSPSGTTVSLFDEICGGSKNFNLNFDDQASSYAVTCPPTIGASLRPTGKLSSFNGETSLGTWVLTVQDNYDGDGGSLTGWGLKICSDATTSLPVNWLTFTGQKATNNTVSLQWSTANETNNKHYEIERSVDGINFSNIGNMAGGNNPTMLQQYFFNDMKPFAGDNYYRLKQVDKDGQFTYSTIVKITLGASRLQWTVYPNPARDQSTIRVLGNLGKVHITLTDVSGKIVYNRSIPSVKAGEQIMLPVSNLARGLYILKVSSGTETKTEKIVLQ